MALTLLVLCALIFLGLTQPHGALLLLAVFLYLFLHLVLAFVRWRTE